VPVESIALLHDSLIVRMQRQSAGVEGAGAFHVPRLHFQYIVVAVSLGIDPAAYGNPEEGWIHIGRKVAPVRKYAAAVENVKDEDVECLRRYHEFHLAITVGHTRHPGRKTPCGRVSALTAFRHVLEVCLEDGLILRSERRFLSEAPWLVGYIFH